MYESGPLYAVKKQNAGKYQTGSFSYVAPKLYVRKGDAERVAAKANKSYNSFLKSASDHDQLVQYATRVSRHSEMSTEDYVADYLERTAKHKAQEEEEGPWIVSEVEIAVVSNNPPV